MDRHKIAREWAETCVHVDEGICVECAAKVIGCVILDMRERCGKIAEQGHDNGLNGIGIAKKIRASG